MEKGAIEPMGKALRAVMIALLLVAVVWQPADAGQATPPWKSYQSYRVFAESHPVFDPTEEYSFSRADAADIHNSKMTFGGSAIELPEAMTRLISEGLRNWARLFAGERVLTVDEVMDGIYEDAAKAEIMEMLKLLDSEAAGSANVRLSRIIPDIRDFMAVANVQFPEGKAAPWMLLEELSSWLLTPSMDPVVGKAKAEILGKGAGYLHTVSEGLEKYRLFSAADLALAVASAYSVETATSDWVYAFSSVINGLSPEDQSHGAFRHAVREITEEYEGRRNAMSEELVKGALRWVWEFASGEAIGLCPPLAVAKTAFDAWFAATLEKQREALNGALVSAQIQRAARIAYERYRNGDSANAEERIRDAGLVYLLAAQRANDNYARFLKELAAKWYEDRDQKSAFLGSVLAHDEKAKSIRAALRDWIAIGDHTGIYTGSVVVKDERGSLLPGVTIRFTGSMDATEDRAGGRWSMDQLAGEITVVPSKLGFEFKPKSLVMKQDLPTLEFIGYPLCPARPTNLTAVATGSQCVDLGWENPCDYTQGFEIWRKGESDAEFKRIAELNNANDPTLANRYDVSGDATYVYKVRAYNHGLFSDFSDVASATTVKAPVGLIAKAVSPTQVDLSWASTSQQPHCVVIERRIGDNGDWQRIDVAINLDSYTDTRVIPGPTNYYRLRATIDGGGVSDWTEEVGATYAYSVSGRVMNENQGVEGAVVTASGEHFTSSVTVGVDGKWQIDGVSGPVVMSAEKTGYVFYPVRSGSVTVEDVTADIDFYSSISLCGYAIDNAGNGIEGVTVGYRSLVAPDLSGTIFTGRDGSWELSGLMGTIRVTASKPGVTFIQSTYEISAPSDAVVFSQVPGESAAGAGQPPAADGSEDAGSEHIDDPWSINGDWSKPHVELRHTPEADLMVRVGDIDLMGLGFEDGYDPSSGTPTMVHRFPWTRSPADPEGTDTIMVPSSFRTIPAPGPVDGYSAYGIPAVPVTLKYDLGDIQVLSAILQIFLDDVQPRDCKGTFRVTIDGVSAPVLDAAVNSTYQGGPIGYLVSVRVPDDYLYLFRDGIVSILIDDPDTGAGDGYAIDFVKLLINPSDGYSVSGKVMNEDRGVEGAVVTASGQHFSSSTTVGADGMWQIDGVRGAITVSVEKPGYRFILTGNRSATVKDTADDIDFYCSYSLSGYAKDSAGNGIGGVRIDYRSLEHPDMSGSILSDPDGSWNIDGLVGTMRVSASRPGITFVQSTYEVSASSDALVFAQVPEVTGAHSVRPCIAFTVLQATCGHDYTVALRDDGSIWTWGDNVFGQLGQGHAEGRIHPTPTQVAGIDGVVSVAAGGSHSLALRCDGTVWAWGRNLFRQLGPEVSYSTMTAGYSAAHSPVRVTGIDSAMAISAGYSHSLALTSDGMVWAWGNNWYGALGDGGRSIERSRPAVVPGLDSVRTIAAGADHSLALTSGGSVWTWGRNDLGQLGDGTCTGRRSPVQTIGLDGVLAIAAGQDHSLALRADGTVWSWGCGSVTPRQVAGLDSATAIAAHGATSLAARRDGTVWSWTGSNGVPTHVGGLSGIVGVEAGYSHFIAVAHDGTLWVWGSNGYGQLGDGTTQNRGRPVQVPPI